MTDGIIIAILVVAIVVGLHSTAKHLAGKGGCCGGSDYKPRKKKLSQILYKKQFQVEGMHCENCKRRVEEVVNDFNGLAGSVNLKKKELTVSYAEEVEDEIIVERLRKAGYSAKVKGNE